MTDIRYNINMTRYTIYLKLMTILALLMSSIDLIAYDFEVDGIYYYKISGTNNEVGVTSYNWPSSNYLGDIIIPESIKVSDKTYLVKKIGGDAFYRCSDLTSVIIPTSVTEIEFEAFYGCTALTSIKIPSSVITIGRNAFDGCTGLTSIVLPKSMESIGDYVFKNCTNLANIELPNYINSIGVSAFTETLWFESQEDGVVYIGNVAYKYKGEAPENTTVVIKDGTTSIASQAFQYCRNITSFDIPNSVVNIGVDAFDGTLWYANQPGNVIYAGNVAYKAKGGVGSSYVFKDGTTGIADNAFKGCSGLTSIELPNSVISIGSGAFSYTGLVSVKLPNSVIKIGGAAFGACYSLTSIEIPNSVTNIGGAAFSACKSLTSIEIPNSVTSIGDAAFSWCTSLTSIEIPNSVTTVGEGAFQGCEALNQILLSNKIKILSSKIFERCSNLTEVIIPESVTSIGMNAFTSCTNLASVDMPNSVTFIGEGAFYQCSNLKSITLPNNLTSIEGGVFSNTGLTSIDIPNSVISIGEYAFNETPLKSIVIPNRVTSIGMYAFYKCQYLVSVKLEIKTPFIIPDDVFYGINSSSVLQIPKGSGWGGNWTKYFKKIEEYSIYYNLSISSSGNGIVTYNATNLRDKSSTFSVEEGEDAIITFTPDKGYRIKSVKLNGTDVTSNIVNNQYTISDINCDNTLEVEFEEITYSLTITSAGNGVVSYNDTSIQGKTISFTIPYGSSATMTITPDTGYKLKSVKLNGKDVTSNVVNNQYTISNVTLDTTIEVVFEQITYSLTIKAIGNGTVTYDETTVRGKSSAFTINYGNNATISIVPDDGYRIKSVKLNETDVTSTIKNNQYTITDIKANTTLEVVFEQIPNYTISIVSEGNGKVTYGSSIIRNQSKEFTIREGNSISVSFTPDSGYRIASVKINGENKTAQVVNNQLTIENISADMTIEVAFEVIPPTNFTLTLKATGNGSVTYNGTAVRGTSSAFTIVEGASTIVTFTPDDGYRIKSVKVNGTDVTSKVANNQYTITNITTDTTLEVEFERITYTLSITATGSGTVSYNDVTTRSKTNTFNVVESSSATLLITPDEGYRIKSLMVNSVDVTSNIKDGKYTISSVTANTTIEVVFEAIPNYTISILSTGNGNVGYDGAVIRNQSQSYSVREGGSITISFSPDKGYRVASVTVNKTDMTGQMVDGQLTISNISSNISVEVVFEEIPPTTYSLTVKVGDNGSVTYDGTAIRNKSNTFTVVEGTYVTVTITPDDGYRIMSVKLNNEDVTSNVKNNQYTISGIGSNTSIEVEFEEIICTLSITSTGNGSVTYDETAIRSKTSTITVSYGTDAVVSFTPDEGYRIKSVTLNGTDVTSKVANNQYTITNITTDTSLEVVFERISYLLTIVSSGNGSASYNGTAVRGKSSSFTLIEGTDAVVSFAPDAGYRIKSVKLNSKEITPNVTNLQYTIASINANTTLEVVFEALPTYTINIVSSGNGRVTYGSVVVRNQSREFSVKEGNSISILFAADNGYRLASVNVNDKDLIGQVVNNQLIIENISADTNIEVAFEAIPITTYSFSVKSTGEGVVTYEGTAIRKQNKMFTVAEGTNAVVVITPDEGYRIKSVTLNGTDVISNVVNYMYSTKIESNTTLEVEFMEDVMEFAIDNVNYKIVSYGDKTIQLASGNYGITLTVPATCTANDRQWTVIGVETDALANCTDLAAIIWNPEVQFNGNIKNPNLLLYVKDKKYAPTTVRNVVVDNVAEEITLSDAESGNPFYCPKAFTAQRIIYEHNYSMTSGYQKCQGWETLVLPFNVTTILRQNGTEIVPRETWVQGSNKLPFWLYTLTELGWRPETTIAANTPYIISMPNNENYNSKYNISGVIQFIGTNVEVKASDNMPVEKNGNKTFVPNYQYLPASENMYALNVNNQWCTNTTTEAEGSVFIKNLRPVHPFEAYLTVSGADAARRSIPIFDNEETGIMELQNIGIMELQNGTYDMTGRKVQGELKRGVYIVNGKKVLVK